MTKKTFEINEAIYDDMAQKMTDFEKKALAAMRVCCKCEDFSVIARGWSCYHGEWYCPVCRTALD